MSDELFSALREWWNEVGHSHRLTETAAQLCDMNSIKRLATTIKKRLRQDHIDLSILFTLVVRGLFQAFLKASSSKRIRPDVDQEYPQNTNKAAGNYGYLSTISLQRLIFVRVGNFRRTYRLWIRCSFAGFWTTDARFGYTWVSNNISCAERYVSQVPLLPDQSVVDINLKDFLNFIQQHCANNPTLRMTCSWNGIPLPSINIIPGPHNQFGGRIELSIETAWALMQYANRVEGGSKE